MQQLSVIITTFNEADNIAGVLASVDWADEIIVVDSFSTDNTAALAQQHPKVRLLQRAYSGPADQKTGSFHRPDTIGFCCWMPMNASRQCCAAKLKPG